MLEFKYVKNKYWQTFILAFLVALLLFLPIALRDAMLWQPFHYAGDYNSQSMLFWQYANQFIKDGGSFSWETELGSGFINSYSYYMLGSPFFWASLWIPSKLMPWAMVPLFCFKFAFAGAGGYLWTKRWVKNPQYAMLAGMLYAFCGYNIYSIFYDSFIDVTALFPYLLAALDDAIIDKRRGCFSIWVAVNLLVNYYFFIGEAVFLILYFVCMLLGKMYILTGKCFWRMTVETVLGIAMGAVLLVPAALSLMQNPRATLFLNDYDFIVYGEPQKYMAILASMFIMPDAPYQNTLFSQSGTQWQNVCAYLPVVGITGGIALCRAQRKHPFARILKFCVICAFIPMLNAIFTLENATYYARWYYMPILVLCGATAMVLDSEPIYQAEWNDAWKTVFIVTVAFVALELVPSDVDLLGFKLGVTTSASIFWILWGISIAGVILCGVVCKKYRRTDKFISVMVSATMVFSFVYGEAHMMLTRYVTDSDTGEHNWFAGYEDLDNVAKLLPQGEWYRIDSNTITNHNLVLGKSCEGFFSSTVSPGIFSFYLGVGHGRSVLPLDGQPNYALRSLLDVKYIMVGTDDEKAWSADVSGTKVTINSRNAGNVLQLMKDNEDSEDTVYEPREWAVNWEECGRTEETIVYENQNFIPMGFTYDYYITKDQLADVDADVRSNLLLKAIVLNDEQVGKYGDLLPPLPQEEFQNLNFESFKKDCADRRKQTADTFETNNYGFTATTSFDTDELVFFSVPYEKNAFTATVNGEPVNVEEVDCGLMAIPVPAGEADIVVTYHTPGLKEGITISITGLIIWILYALVCYNKGKKKGTPELQEAKESTEAVE